MLSEYSDIFNKLSFAVKFPMLFCKPNKNVLDLHWFSFLYVQSTQLLDKMKYVSNKFFKATVTDNDTIQSGK